MQRLVSLLFLVLYAVALLRPVEPLLEYYIRYDYFAKELCLNRNRPELHCNGKCILMQRLKQASEQQQPAAPVSADGVNLKEYPVGFVTTFSIVFHFVFVYSLSGFDQRIQFPISVAAEIFHPPA